MAKFNIPGWEADKTRRLARVNSGLCPMCASPKRAEDQYCSDPCKTNDANGDASKEGTP